MKPIFRRCNRRRNKSAITEAVFFRKEGQGSFFSPAPAGKTAAYANNLKGSGQSLPTGINQFFSSRMGYDFSNVKVHTGKDAADSAKDINARAYTKGNNIVFNDGQYNVESKEGKKLMAHELTHVIQQDRNGQQDNVDRKTTFKESKKGDINLAQSLTQAAKGVGVPHTGITNAFLNGHDMTKSTVYPLKVPAEKDISATQKNNQYEASVTTTPDNEMKVVKHIPLTPKGKIWSFKTKADDFSSIVGNQCNGKRVNVEVSGDPDAATVISAVSTHEQNHVTQFKTVYNNHVVTYDTNMKTLKATGATPKESKTKLIALITTDSKVAYTKLVTDYSTIANAFHQTPQGAEASFSTPSIDTACKKIESKVKA